MEERDAALKASDSSTKGKKAIKWAHFFMILHILAMCVLISESMRGSFGEYLSHIEQKFSVMFMAFMRLNIEPIAIWLVGSIGMNFISIGALILTLLALLKYKRQDAKSTVTFGIILIIATSVLALGLPNFPW